MPEVRLIDASALIGFLHNQTFIDGDDRSLVYKWIEEQPSVEAEPVRHGRWIEMTYHPVGDNMYCDCNCSNCNFEITREKGRYPKFCENCGADMREEQGD